MVKILWREGWIKPLFTESLPLDFCVICKKEFSELDFVTSCEFCEKNFIHESCCNTHILSEHKSELEKKIHSHKEKRLHSYQ